ncbi:hypothetical protein L6R46_08500 [Myxococcota bacterium]|nr:hypothetical protein [Myxococcota bacterium]
MLLLTWRDVAERMSPPLSDERVSLVAEVDRFSVRVYTDDVERALRELSERIGPAFDQKRRCVELLGVPEAPRTLPVELLPSEDAPERPNLPQRPLWATPHIDLPAFVRGPGIATNGLAAFFSFKGGVGRTTACFASVIRMLDREDPPRVLFIDADVEAPGLTWFVNHEERLSWLDALALIQDADDWRAEALPIIAERIEASTIALELPAGRREFFIMPAVRGLSQLVNVPVPMEQAIRRRGHAWVIGDLLMALKERLELDAIVVDLRAGLTEMSSPLLLDPRVHNVLVTSCSPQSVEGIKFALERAELKTGWPLSVDMLVTQVPPSGDQRFQEVRQALIDAWAGARDKQDSDDGVVPEPARVDFEQQLIVFDEVQNVADRLRGTSLWRAVEGVVERMLPQRVVTPPRITGPVSREAIAKLAARYEYAEKSEGLALLATPPLKSLARRAIGQLPLSVVIGSKGAGKTFAWAQLVRAATWSKFAEAVGVNVADANDALVFPLLRPKNIGDDLQAAAERAEKTVATPRMHSGELANRLHELKDNDDAKSFWLRAIVERLNLPHDASRSVRELDEALRERGQRVVLVVDGLEDALQSGPGKPIHEAQKRALRELMQDLVNDLRELRAQQLGVVVFVRQDIAREAIPQNYGQFAARHDDVALSWSSEDALRLVLWLLEQAGWSLLPSKDITSEPYERLAKALHPFWNEKMGGGREAFTDRWAIAAISDLNGRFQARDLVRLLRWASNQSDVIPLRPQAIRDAIRYCSEMKIEELEAEVGVLKKVFDKLRGIPEDEKTIPLGGDKLRLDEEEVSFLKGIGLLIFDEKEQLYYMPEIIRQGLDFKLSRVGRARVLGLQQLALKQRR